jgi:hypothetical protein
VHYSYFYAYLTALVLLNFEMKIPTLLLLLSMVLCDTDVTVTCVECDPDACTVYIGGGFNGYVFQNPNTTCSEIGEFPL